jgi:hypothetical protein
MIEPTMKDVGRQVVYKQAWMQPKDYEHGIVTGFNEHFVFVRYGSETQAKSTKREDLTWAGTSRTSDSHDPGWGVRYGDGFPSGLVPFPRD